ncbi:MAG TPA: class I adenylate-forming enzyme family protein, partial [Chthoniobacteraceae bacterium]|nr:class I adenylate-forming enzyme family protein [Chthoniobacteraceae bacterium]
MNRPNSILAAWEKTLRLRAPDAALRDDSGIVLRTFSDVETEARALGRELAIFQDGAVVAVQIGNSASWPAVLLALWRRGLVALPLGSQVEGTERRLIEATCHVGGIVSRAGDRLTVIRRDAEPPCWEGPPPDLLKLTSGTTAAPRAVRFRAAQLHADADQICATMGITAADLNFGAIPFSHSYGFSNLVTPLLTHGVPLVATEERLPRALWQGLRRSGATVFPGLPVFFEKMSALDEARDGSRLRLCISAGAPLLASVAGAFTRAFGLKIHSFYGSSECGGICYDRSDEPNYDDGWVGQPMDGVRLEHTAQRIAVHSAAVGDGYFPTPDPEVLSRGRFVPGDLVEERNGGCAIVGRSTDVINIAGRKLNPGEIEGRIAAFPGVRQVVVFGVPSALRGEEPVACV